jgi:hypothetical protein
MLFVLECISSFFETFMVLILSQSIGMDSSYSTCISVRVCFIQRTRVQHVIVSIYSSSAVDKDIDDCLLLFHDTKYSYLVLNKWYTLSLADIVVKYFLFLLSEENKRVATFSKFLVYLCTKFVEKCCIYDFLSEKHPI